MDDQGTSCATAPISQSGKKAPSTFPSMYRQAHLSLAPGAGQEAGGKGGHKAHAGARGCAGHYEVDDALACTRQQLMLRDDMSTAFQGVHSMWCFVWQDNLVLMSRVVRDAMRMARTASSGDELNV